MEKSLVFWRHAYPQYIIALQFLAQQEQVGMVFLRLTALKINLENRLPYIIILNLGRLMNNTLIVL